MGLFAKLFGRFTAPAKTPQAKRERLRETLAEEAARKEVKQANDFSAASLKARIAAGQAEILASIGSKGQADIAKQHAEHLERLAETERRIRQSQPSYLFLVGQYQLLQGRDFNSSNVYRIWYEPHEIAIYVTFQEEGGAGATYKYWPILLAEAKSIFEAVSKGTFVWDNFRVRGTALGHRKNYAMVNSGSSPWKWEATEQSAEEHAQKVATQSGAASPNDSLTKFMLPTPMGNKGKKT